MAITLTEFGKTLRKARIDHDISLKDLADLLNLSPAFLSGVETGRKAVNPSLINKITSVMNLSKTESDELNIAASKTLKEVSLRVNSDHDAEIAIMFARKVEENKVDFVELRKFLMNT